jgi:hypothetical protein
VLLKSIKTWGIVSPKPDGEAAFWERALLAVYRGTGPVVAHTQQVSGLKSVTAQLGVGGGDLVIVICTNTVLKLVVPGEGVIAFPRSTVESWSTFMTILVASQITLVLVRP